MRSTIGVMFVLLVGIGLGVGGDRLATSRGPSPASASTMAPMARPIGDAQMMEAMKHMDRAMMVAHLNGDQDHDFMQMMIPHHRAAIEMAQVEIRHGVHPQLKAVAHDIITGQTKEIAQMQRWLAKWYADARNK